MFSKKFVEILDEEQKRKDARYGDLLNILRLSDHHYIDQQYYAANFVGEQLIAPLYTPPKPTTVDIKSIIDGFAKFPPFMFPPPNSLAESISKDIVKTKDVVKTKHVNIDASINSIGDILKVLTDYEYNEETEYNIDLKVLTQIQPELAELNAMVGLTQFKNDIVNQLLYFVQRLHVGTNPDFMHTVLSGPPGTGKTEIAMILGRMYSKIGILEKNTFKKVTRSDLVAGYLGQTAIKTRKVIDECLGGCLFIDEAYALANDYGSDSFSRECIDTLCEALSAHKGELMVIVAGYKDELKNTFFKANRGMESRFIWRFHLDDYSYLEMLKIFQKKVKDNEWTLLIEDPALKQWFQKNHETFKYFGRDMELLFSYCKVVHGRRIYGQSNEIKKQLTMHDIQTGFARFKEHATLKDDPAKEIYGLYV
jgi:hypothetical protein